MAGREHAGPRAASAALFRGATWILCSDGASAMDLQRTRDVVMSLGAVPVTMTAGEHDAAVAAISHLPQVLASALVQIAADDPHALDLAAGSFRDLTRVALSEPCLVGGATGHQPGRARPCCWHRSSRRCAAGLPLSWKVRLIGLPPTFRRHVGSVKRWHRRLLRWGWSCRIVLASWGRSVDRWPPAVWMYAISSFVMGPTVVAEC